MKKEELAKRIITSILDTEATTRDVVDFIAKLKPLPFYGVAVDLTYIATARKELEDSRIKVITVSSYPLGGMTLPVKVKQFQYAIKEGAAEIDVCLDYYALKSKRYTDVENELKALIDCASNKIKPVFIPQFSILTNDEKRKVCELILKAGGSTVKTNTGYGFNTDVEDIKLIKREFGDDLELEASGGIRTAKQAVEVLEAGCTLIHTSTPFQIVEGLEE